MVDGGLKAVFLAERAMLLRLLSARLGDAAEAEDALQDMWLRIATGEPRPVANPQAYLYRVAANIATDRRVAAFRRGRLDQAWSAVQPAAAEHPDAERMLAARSELARVDAILAAMPERMRTAYSLFRIDQVPQREIATRMGISLSGVEKLLQRAYRRFHGGSDDE